MGNKKASRPPTSKTSSASAPAASGATVAGNKSSVLRAAFSPSEHQLALFASVIQGLDAQHLRIHDINTGRLQCEHAVAPKEAITSLDWGYYYSDRSREREQQSKKKRKRNSGVNGALDGADGGDVVVAFGTTTSEIRMYSPIEDKVIATLSGGHDGGIKDFKFTAGRTSAEGWSIGGDNKLVQWDLRTGRSIRTVHLPTTSVVTALSRPTPSNPPVICATQTPYIIDVEKSDEPPLSFPAMRNPIHTLISSSTDSVMAGHFLASDADRYINIFDPSKKGLVMNLVAEKEVSSLSLYAGKQSDKNAVPLDKQILAVVVEDGTIELFTKPFLRLGESEGSKTTSLKAKARQMTRKADAHLKIVRPESGKLVSVVKTEFQGPELLIAWAEGGVNVIFERVRWQDEDTEELAFLGTKEVTARKSASVLGSATVNEAREVGQTQVDETNAVIDTGRFADDVEMNDSRDDAVSISGEEEEASDEEAESRESKKVSEKRQVAQSKGSTDKDVEMQDAGASEAEEEGDEGAEPSFGELLRANATEAIDVEAELEDDAGAGPLVPGKANTVSQIPSGVSLSTVLTQALKTNDNEMLESCFHTGDLNIIRTTIQRLDSSLAATLLQRLAERLAARPGRYGHLLVWVQWTCIAHGGAIAGKADILKRMSALYKVMDQRSSSLPSLLLLKGKLDMLDAQLNLRQSTANRGADGMDSEDDEDIIYVEGQDDDSEAEGRKASTITPRTKSMRDTHGMLTDENEADAIPNGIGSGPESDNEDEEGSEDEAEDDENLVDIEAEESVGSSDAEESLEENEDDDEEDEESDEGSAGSLVDFIADSEEELSEADDDDGATKSPPPSKKAKLSGKGNKASGRR